MPQNKSEKCLLSQMRIVKHIVLSPWFCCCCCCFYSQPVPFGFPMLYISVWTCCRWHRYSFTPENNCKMCIDPWPSLVVQGWPCAVDRTLKSSYYWTLFQDYTVEKVLDEVRRWRSSVRSPQSISTFYLFVVLSLLGFGTSTKSGLYPGLKDTFDMFCVQGIV